MDLFLVLIDNNITAYIRWSRTSRAIVRKLLHRNDRTMKKRSEKEKVEKYDNRKLMTRYLSRSCGHWLPRQMLPDWKLPYIGQEMATTGLPMFAIETVPHK